MFEFFHEPWAAVQKLLLNRMILVVTFSWVLASRVIWELCWLCCCRRKCHPSSRQDTYKTLLISPGRNLRNPCGLCLQLKKIPWWASKALSMCMVHWKLQYLRGLQCVSYVSEGTFAFHSVINNKVGGVGKKFYSPSFIFSIPLTSPAQLILEKRILAWVLWAGDSLEVISDMGA